MGLCKDDAITYLNGLGYNVVRHPRAGVAPLQLLGRQQGEASILGSIERLFRAPSRPAPAVTRDQPGADIEGRRSSSLSAAIGLDLLGAFLGAVGGKLGVRAAFDRARTITFEFRGVLVDSVMPLDLGDWMRGGEPDAGNLVLREYVLGNGDLYVLTEVVKSRKLAVTATGKDGGTLELEVPVVQDLVGGSVKVSPSAARATVVEFEGAVDLAFGFKCFQVGVENGVLSLQAARPSGALAFAAGPAGAPNQAMRPVLLHEAGLIGFGD